MLNISVKKTPMKNLMILDKNKNQLMINVIKHINKNQKKRTESNWKKNYKSQAHGYEDFFFLLSTKIN